MRTAHSNTSVPSLSTTICFTGTKTSPSTPPNSRGGCALFDTHQSSIYTHFFGLIAQVALRVTPDAEGPTATKLKLPGAAASAPPTAPPLTLTLEDGAAYFMLDDFNHHHQHAVLTGAPLIACHASSLTDWLLGESSRYASTHRVSRIEGHTYQYIAERCRRALNDGKRKTLKSVKGVMAALIEVECEWIRQFYIQGSAYMESHKWWQEPMGVLLDLWRRLEESSAATVDQLLKYIELKSATRSAKSDEDVKGKRKAQKQIMGVEALGDDTKLTLTTVYDALIDRREKRNGWAAREADPVWKRLPASQRPVSVPWPRDLSPTALDKAISTLQRGIGSF